MRKQSKNDRPRDWADRVAFSTTEAGSFAYRPGEVIVGGGEQGVDVARRRFPTLADPTWLGPRRRRAPKTVAALRGDIDPLEVVHELRAAGIAAQPNHVVFAHQCGCCCGPHPSTRWGACMSGSPMYGSSMYGSPMYGSPMYGSPMYGSPMYGSPFTMAELQATGPRRSSARPAPPPTRAPRPAPKHAASPRVAILDTGLAHADLRPAALGGLACDPADHEVPDDDADGWLDPAAGHGTFIAGVIEQLAPGCTFTLRRVLSGHGDGDELAAAAAIDALAGKVDILNLSFGGFAMDGMHVLAAAVRRVQQAGAVVVASAGNEGTCRAVYPAAFPGVVSVGALGPHGPAPFTNHGPWVRACAPGVDLVSSFFSDFDGASPPTGGVDPDRFESWAVWSGTSFATPVVVAALAREMACYGLSAADAVARVVDDPGLVRIPDLGTVVNLR
ncbi:MAG TPA: S8/S53 family peptidase [Acidimicrobiales bacterium]|nr:S8/S53 family peptidase [Acidimicrobiales bacterium]